MTTHPRGRTRAPLPASGRRTSRARLAGWVVLVSAIAFGVPAADAQRRPAEDDPDAPPADADTPGRRGSDSAEAGADEAAASDAEPDEPDGDAADPDAPPAPPALPAPTLEEDEPIAPAEPQPEPEEEQPEILHHIGTGDHPEWEEDAEGGLPPDIAFETPGDLRASTAQSLQGGGPQARLPEAEPSIAPRTFELAVAAGYARLLAAEAVDYVRLEERFEARLPELEAIRLGAGATQMISPDARYLVGGGVRIGFGTFFCDAGWVQCEGVATVQPGVLGGDVLGVRFDLNASLDLRFVIEHVVELSIGGGYSLLGETSLLHVTAQGGLVF